MKQKSRASIAIAFIAALSATVPTATVAGPAWQPAGGWTIRQDDHCVAELRFAHKSQQLQFAIEPGPTSPFNFAYLVTDGDGEFGWTKADIAIGTKWKAGQTIHVMPSKLPHHIAYKWGLSDEQLGALETAGRIQVVSEDLRVDLSLPDLAAARSQLRGRAILHCWRAGDSAPNSRNGSRIFRRSRARQSRIPITRRRHTIAVRSGM